jgi:hypothetical protein
LKKKWAEAFHKSNILFQWLTHTLNVLSAKLVGRMISGIGPLKKGQDVKRIFKNVNYRRTPLSDHSNKPVNPNFPFNRFVIGSAQALGRNPIRS